MAVRGVALLRSKRDALANEFFALTGGLLDDRERLEAGLREAARAVTLARALDGDAVLESLALAGAREVPVEIERRRVWGVPTPDVTAPGLVRDVTARGASPSSVSLCAAEAARTHEVALDLLLAVCARETRLRRLGAEIRKTSRRITALERFLIPGLNREVSRIELVLEEREREDLSRLKRFKARNDGGAS